jgi:glutathione S-transferase
MALEHRGIPFDSEFIKLFDKPEWYEEVVPTKLVPAVRFTSDGVTVWESVDIMLAIEERFPDAPNPLLPADPQLRAEALELVQQLDNDGLGKAGYQFLLGAAFGEKPNPSRVPEFKGAFEEKLQALETQLGKYPGPFIMGESLSIVDVCYAPVLSRFGAQLPTFRAFSLRANPKFPNLRRWYEAMEALPAYQRVNSDDGTHNLVINRLFKLPFPEGGAHAADPCLIPPAVLKEGVQEAGGKLVANHEAVVADVIKNSELVSLLEAGGGKAAPDAAAAIVDVQLRRLAEQLLHGSSPQSEDEYASCVLTFVRDRVSSPRDMSAAAAYSFRDACNVLLAA